MTNLYHDYEINEKELTTKVNLPPKILIFVFVLVTFFLNFLIAFFLIAELGEVTSFTMRLILGGIYAPFVFIGGVIGWKYWQITGRAGARSTYLPFVESRADLGWFAKLYVRFLEQGSAVYFEATSKDVNARGPIGVIKIFMRISLTQLGFFITVLSLMVKPLLSGFRDDISLYDEYFDVFNLFFALGISVVIVGTYYPMTIILENSNIKTFNPKTRFIKVPGATLRGRLDAFVGIGAVSTGWAIFNDLQGGEFILVSLLETSHIFIVGVDYFLWLIYIMILSWPILFPASLFFYMTLEGTINEFRSKAIGKGVNVGVSKIREPSSTELENIKLVSEKYQK